MQWYLALLLFAIALLCDGTFSQLGSGNTTALNTRTFVKKDCDGIKTYICDSCTSRRPCFGTQEIEATFTCGTGLFCIEGTATDRCSPTPSEACITSSASSSFTCTATGVFPDPNNCNYYHVCLAISESSSVYRCPPGYVFDVVTSSCIRQLSAANCVTVTCPVGAPRYVLYGTSRVYYAVCNGASLPTQVLRCPNGALFTFFTSSTIFGECVYTCSGQGNYANSNNPGSYFQCYISNGRLVYNELDCPSGTIFNQTLRYCTRQ
ncbi:uncharacterized protein LOC128708258 [Anopheles marshallii]|uniref:uncharacterized protein LOC128708258 n=1 Tax=Anopheles marshallii TaxID=1521116 RepID=UPI00237A5ECE|nr:uncharacterized protein LOC128708258 [Anopheles marshallii]